MDVKIVILYTVGLFWLYIQTCCASSLNVNRLRRFSDNDQRTRNKRNATLSYTEGTTADAGGGVEEPAWTKYYGFDSYKQRKPYQENPNKKPTICFNNKTKDSNGDRLPQFICPMDDSQSEDLTYCCGQKTAQVCCNRTKYNEEKRKEKQKYNNDADIDLVTAIGISAGCVVSITFCMFLYCCCCQRRHEIHDGVKLMWVRRSFGKELNRLEQPAYQDHMTVVNSITGLRETSRQGSRQGSRHGSRQASRQGSIRSNRSRQGSFKGGSRNPSAAPTPSISRRASNDHHDRTPLKHQKGTGDRNHLGLDVPSNVVITVTTPSDEHGPTAPLLKTAHHERCNPVHVHFDDVIMTSSPS
ncbi:uncharacterized protein LOC132723425 isoform X1 [Ruditapes philippinarum]|uniref:uncharacterized protein LOC132723425 isoform X1 n=1 Tax=Ruditapes philippinarum TaxID=129788 RepID=UPI00295ABD9C|nr:uncharacterized protein LOC132723425 isoform X1 [Ruditapes philippinarum]